MVMDTLCILWDFFNRMSCIFVCYDSVRTSYWSRGIIPRWNRARHLTSLCGRCTQKSLIAE